MDTWTDRLSEYVDGTLAAAERAALDTHLATCADCRTTAAELAAVAGAARALPDVPPARDLWPEILAGIRAADADVVPFPHRPRRRVSATLPQLAAAAVLLMTVSGGAVWLALRAPDTAPTVTTTAPPADPRTPVALPVSAVEDNYGIAIRELEILLSAMRDRLDPATVEVIEANLAIIDAAIADARRAIASNPDDLYLYEHLDGTMMKKVELLRRATSLARAQT